MQSLRRFLGTACAAGVVLVGLSACSLVQKSSPSNFYVLSASLPQGQQPLFEQAAPQAPVLLVSAVRVASFLDRPQVTLRSAGNTVEFDEFVRWAEPLSDGVARALRANFVTLLGTPESALPWVRAGNRDFNLFVYIEDIQLLADNQLELRLSFRLSDGQSNNIVLAGERTYVSAVPQTDNRNQLFAALPEALSAQLGAFSVAIARDAALLKGIAAASAEPALAKTSATTAESTASATEPAATPATTPAAASPSVSAESAAVPAAAPVTASPSVSAKSSVAPAAALAEQVTAR